MMEKREIPRGIPQIHLTRRDFFKVATATGLGLLAGLKDSGQSIPEQIQPYPQAGWLETSLPTRPYFINYSDGHATYLRHIALNSPVVRRSLAASYTDLFHDSAPHSPRLGDVFRQHVRYAATALAEIYPGHEPSVENQVHIALFSMAAQLSPYFTFREIQDLGVSLDVPDNRLDDILSPLKIVNDRIPHVYPVDIARCQSQLDAIARCVGGDRAVHFSQHVFITAQYLYILRHGLREAQTLPGNPFLRMLFPSALTQVGITDGSAQIFWEIKETLDQMQGKLNSDVQTRNIATGFFDDHIDRDFEANTTGLYAGILLSMQNVTRDDVTQFSNFLNQDFFYQTSQVTPQHIRLPA